MRSIMYNTDQFLTYIMEHVILMQNVPNENTAVNELDYFLNRTRMGKEDLVI